MSIGFEILLIGLLILANGVFAMSEMAVITARKSRLQDWIKRGNRGAKVALDLALAPNRFLPAVQICITVAGVLAGAIAGRGIAQWLAAYLQTVPMIAPYHQEIGLALVVLIVTYFALVIGELAPKRFAMRRPETIATWVAVPLHYFSRAFAPLVYLLSVSTDIVCRLFGKPLSQDPAVTEDDIRTLVQQGAQAGVLEEEAEEMVDAVLRLGEKTARSLMTPRTQITWLDLENSMEQNYKKIIESGRSRFPVAAGSLDKVMGVVQAKDLFAVSLAGKPIDLAALMQQPLFVPRTISVLELLESFKKTSQHIALVVDEYGGIEGLLTHHDILEAIAGDIPTGEKPVDAKAVRRHDGSWLLDGMLSVDEFKEIFQVETLPGEKRDAYQTLGGFVFTQMGRVPSVAESFEWHGLRFEIVDMDGKRIDKVLVNAAQTDAAANLVKDGESLTSQSQSERTTETKA
ncbi:MAG TPA: hemolysin family protein [Candidatus Binatia bacterium]|nr:hemolysin family protein [Candidatus Binatia bacterium]